MYTLFQKNQRWLIIHGLLESGSANFLCEGPEGKYFWLCQPYVFCRNYSALPLSLPTEAAGSTRTGMAVLQCNFIYKNQQQVKSGPWTTDCQFLVTSLLLNCEGSEGLLKAHPLFCPLPFSPHSPAMLRDHSITKPTRGQVKIRLLIVLPCALLLMGAHHRSPGSCTQQALNKY